MRIILFYVMLTRSLCINIKTLSFIAYPKYTSRLFNNSTRTFNSTLKSHYSDETLTKIFDKFENIRNDKVEIVANNDSVLKKNLGLRSYNNLVKYTKELDSVLSRSSFIGCTAVEKDKSLDNLILHFRGCERAENICLCFNPKYFPLFPTVSSPYRSFTERSLDYLEHVLSGLTGLRVTRIHTPFQFQNIIAIDFADTAAVDNILYRIIILVDRTNKLLLVDNTDQIVLASSECLLEHDVKDFKDIIGKRLAVPPATKKIPSADETFEEFFSNFKGLNGMNITKAILSVYQGLDFHFVSSLCSEMGIDTSYYVYNIPDLKAFHEHFINKIKSIINNDGPYEDMITRVYDVYGCLSPSYRLNRLLEKTIKMAEEFKNRFEKIADNCVREENDERLAVVNEKIESISDYKNAIEDIRVSRDPKKLENLEDFHEQLLMINDLSGYKLTKKKKKVEKVKETSVKKKTKKVGKILQVPVNDKDDSPMMIVGKNAKQNEVVTLDMRQKGDLWFHAKDCPGAHVLLRNFRNDDRSIQIAADIASFFSKYKELKNVEVVVADIEKVRKEKESQIGAVMVQEYKTVVGNPERGGRFINDYKGRSGQ